VNASPRGERAGALTSALRRRRSAGQAGACASRPAPEGRRRAVQRRVPGRRPGRRPGGLVAPVWRNRVQGRREATALSLGDQARQGAGLGGQAAELLVELARALAGERLGLLRPGAFVLGGVERGAGGGQRGLGGLQLGLGLGGLRLTRSQGLALALGLVQRAAGAASRTWASSTRVAARAAVGLVGGELGGQGLDLRVGGARAASAAWAALEAPASAPAPRRLRLPAPSGPRPDASARLRRLR